ncbi:MAG: hypothetical protein ACAI35_19860 [Candidatus Methylacidiphilales bacterium]|nr:hypothetical protein [Candidatus Methylacidiphilales bacterium]
MSNSQAATLAKEKESIYRKARIRLRLERLSSAFGIVLPVASVALAVCILLTFVYAKLALFFPLCVGIFILLLLAAAAWGWFAPIRQQHLWARLDRVADLKDGVLTMEELALQHNTAETTIRSEWAQTQRTLVLKQLNWDNIRKGWPLHIPRTTQFAAILCLLLMGFFATGFYSYKPSAEELASRQLIEDQAKAIEEIAQDWEKVQQEQPSEELQKALEEIKPLRDRLAKGDITEKELMQELSRVESRLEAMQKEAKGEAMDPALAKDLAEALEALPNTAGLTAALKKNDLEAAQRQAEETARQWDKPESKAAATPLSQEARDKMAKAADRADAAKMDSIAAGMRQMSEAGQPNSNTSKNGSKSMSDSMKQMQSGLAKAGECQKKGIKLSLQLLQLSQCKSSMSNCKSQCVSISLFKKMCSGSGGKNAGTATTGNPYGAATSSDAKRHIENLTGVMGEGDSETTTETTNEPTPAGSLATKTATFKSYEKLSKVAIEDENLPLAHRESIKRYFESIRPRDQQ